MSELPEPGVLLATLAGAAVLKYTFGAIIRWKYSQDFKLVGRVSSLNIFPAKSCAGYSPRTAHCTLLGLRDANITDRHFVFVKPNGDYLHQRIHPKMALIKFTSKGDDIEISAPGMPTIKVPKDTPVDRSKVVLCKVDVSKVEGQDCGDEAGQWVSDYLEVPGARLMYSARGLQKKDVSSIPLRWGNPALSGDQAAYPDFGSYLVMTENSVEALNERLNKPVTMDNFRPNIVVQTDTPFQEDTWHEIKIGDTVRIRMVDYCTRCILTTVDPKTGVKSLDGEPLKTLRSFRCFEPYGAAPCFGIYAAADVPGPIKVGDPVYAIQKKS